ncbi:hypothetical protein [Fundidesulfovibrio putealis]|uniref:hypothetical protein n=1 Tax=Fundidesulfovibrio putealis TaxID=270496 RepID=UPI0012EBC398|nr:hypothetical protein [Fundidesulfovibrio putealis]
MLKVSLIDWDRRQGQAPVTTPVLLTLPERATPLQFCNEDHFLQGMSSTSGEAFDVAVARCCVPEEPECVFQDIQSKFSVLPLWCLDDYSENAVLGARADAWGRAEARFEITGNRSGK